MSVFGALSDRHPERCWADLRRRERILRYVAVSFAPGFLLLLWAINLVRPDVPQEFALWVVGIWVAAFVAASLYQQSFRCPRCSSPFFKRSNSHSRSCAHCGLAIGAPVDRE